jgi:D-beta-D-heptose 7-phosphate kinase/D-beta-D-heptose 1-phosphate adenosyltransferase
MTTQFRNIINAFKDRHILIIGDLILDNYIFGKVNRISPEAPVPVLEVTEESSRLGGATNVAHNIVSLGAKATVAGVIGDDKEGETLLGQCKLKGIATEGVIIANRPTTVKTRIIAHHQQVVRVDKEDTQPLSTDSYLRLLDYVKRHLRDYDGVIVSDYKKGVVSAGLIKDTAEALKGRFIAVDPKVGNFHCYKGVTIITPNLKEASEGSGIPINDEDSLIKAGHKLLKTLSLKALLITRGEQGMSLFEKDKGEIKVTHIRSVAKSVFDVTGAGDTVIAVFTLALLSGASMVDAARVANHAAGIVVGEVGTAVVSPQALLKALETT